MVSFQLITKLLEKSEVRGIDAAGFWGVQSGDDGKILYHKEPGKSSFFVKRDAWKRVGKFDPDLLLVHARAASKGVGEPHCNKNNHPFTNPEKTVGLVHNGRIEDHEYQALKQKYEVRSECDSEILLRIFEGADRTNLQEFDGVDNPHRMAGIRDIFSYINDGHMAVAIGDRGDNGDRCLWLFRNRHRPLWIIDMRESLGQVFFVSEPKIWEEAVRECQSIGRISQTQKLIELPVEEVWYFKTTKDKPCPENVHRFQVNKDKNPVPWQYDGKRVNVVKKTSPVEVVTQLDETEEPKHEASAESYNVWELHKKATEIQELVSSIVTTAENLAQEMSIEEKDFQEIIDSLDNIHRDLEGTYSIIER